MTEDALKKEAENLSVRYKEELRKQKIMELTNQLSEFENNEEKTMEILKQIERIRRE